MLFFFLAIKPGWRPNFLTYEEIQFILNLSNVCIYFLIRELNEVSSWPKRLFLTVAVNGQLLSFLEVVFEIKVQVLTAIFWKLILPLVKCVKGDVVRAPEVLKQKGDDDPFTAIPAFAFGLFYFVHF